VGAVLIAYAGYALRGPAVQVSARMEKRLSPLMGGLTGVITGATGVFVIPAVPWLQALGFRRDELVQALGLSFTLSTLAMAAGLSARWLARRFAAAVGAGAGARAARHVAGTADPLASQPAALSSGLSVVPAGAGAGACPPGLLAESS
jgi:uncharacterized membrane protein YfcA